MRALGQVITAAIITTAIINPPDATNVDLPEFPALVFNPWEAHITPNVACRSWPYSFVAWASSALNFSQGPPA